MITCGFSMFLFAYIAGDVPSSSSGPTYSMADPCGANNGSAMYVFANTRGFLSNKNKGVIIAEPGIPCWGLG